MIKNNLDEMQESKLLKIEHNACWIAYCGIILAIVIQLIISAVTGKNISVAGETAVLIIMNIYIVFSSIRNAVRYKDTTSGMKAYTLIILLISLGVSLFEGIMSFIEQQNILFSILYFILMFAVLFVSLMALCIIFRVLFKHKEKKMDELADEDEDDDMDLE